MRIPLLGRRFAETLDVEAVVAVRVSGEVAVGEVEKNFSDVNRAGVRRFGNVCKRCHQLVEAFDGLLLVPLAFGELVLLAGNLDVPPASLFAKPRRVRTRHGRPSE